MEHIDELMKELLDMDIITDADEVIFTDESKDLIHIMATQCREKDIYKRTEVQGQEYAKDMTAEELFKDLIFKLASAPTRFHMCGTVRLLIPLIDDKLRETN